MGYITRPEVQCFGKDAHETREHAQAALRNIQRRGLKVPKDKKLEVYKCPHCEGWHIGKGPKR